MYTRSLFFSFCDFFSIFVISFPFLFAHRATDLDVNLLRRRELIITDSFACVLAKYLRLRIDGFFSLIHRSLVLSLVWNITHRIDTKAANTYAHRFFVHQAQKKKKQI